MRIRAPATPWRRARVLALALAVSACTRDDGATGPPTSSVEGADIVITAVDPDTATVDTTITVRITGSGFTDSSTATWLIDTTAATQIRTVSTTWKSDTELQAVIIISPDAALRSYSIRIRGKKGKQGIAVEKFRIVAKPTALPEPGTRSQAYDINDSGVIVGSGDTPSSIGVAIRWTPRDSGWTYSILGNGGAYAINNEGIILRRDYDFPTAIWRSWVHLPSGVAVDFGTAILNDISDDGTIVGAITPDVRLPSTPAVWRRVSADRWGPPQTLPVPTGFTSAGFDAISGSGHIIGAISAPDTTLSVVWRYHAGQWLMPDRLELQLPAGAGAINDSGALVGYVRPCNIALPSCWSTAVFWPSPGGARRTLPTLYNSQARANDLNNSNQVVGAALVHYNDPDSPGPLAALVWHAVIWFPGSQWPEDLGAIRPQHNGEAMAINNRGWVVGSMKYNDLVKQHATVWKLPATPTIVPSASRR